MKWTIRQTTKETGLSADTLRYYEKEGMISPKRHENGYRYYDERDISILKNIVVMKYAHFTLAEMKSMEELQTREANSECNEICKQILNSKITELNQAILNYQKIVTLLEALLPMVDSIEAYRSNEERVDEFISNIFNDIQSSG
ncbi:MAG: MerR family transcriptional regulator [Prevotellaceae bacterium]|jgi:DNA-binding transcriptional MerR regulator|nr:MerR family transcriptional regulator [Prevotellaceae bacterium]